MSISVYIGHSGQRLSLDPSDHSSIDSVKAWLHSRAAIQPRNQILLTVHGKHVRPQTLLTENDIFVFDAARINNKAPALDDSDQQDDDFDPGLPPDTISDTTNLQAWQDLFSARSSWADGLLRGCQSQAAAAQQYQDELSVIERSLGVAVASLQLHLKSGEQKYGSVEAWARQVSQDHEGGAEDWEANLESLGMIPAKQEFARFLQQSPRSGRRPSQQDNRTTLQSFIDVAAVRKAAAGANNPVRGLDQKVTKMRKDLATASKGTEELVQAVEQMSARSTASNVSEPAHLLEEIEIVLRKMASDLEHVQSLPTTQQSVSQASKMALLHTRNYLPSISEYCSEMNDHVHRTHEQRNIAAAAVAEHMRTLSHVESILADVYQSAKTLDVPNDDQQDTTALNIVSRLPSVYGALLVESVRRREWVAKVRRDAATLQEEVATYQDEEETRRKRWIRSVEDVVKTDALRSNVLGIELSLINEGGSWPAVSRDDLQEYLDYLLQVYGPCAVTEEMDLAIKELDKPTRKQIKHAKAFKNGSMHEAAFGDTSLLLRGDDQYRSLRDTNTRLEEELKGQKSRVRKLEDLLHRSSTIGRASSGDIFAPSNVSSLDRNFTLPSVLPSPLSEESSRTNPLQHQRKASVQRVEEKKLARRIVDLEAELEAAKAEANSRKSSDAEAQKQVEEAVSTKRDLMQNMEAQQREFASERRTLEKELAETKEKIEELENELERLVGSRDDERNGLDARVVEFEQEIRRLKHDASGHAARAATAQDAKVAMERKLEVAERMRAEAEEQLQQMRHAQERRQEAESEQLQFLATAHSHLSPGTDVPTGLTEVTAALEELARRSAAQLKDLEDAVAFAKSENESLWSSNERQKTELATASQKQTDTEDEIRRVQEQLTVEEAKVKSLEQQLSDEQEQLRLFRAKFAEGETGSEVLRQRVAEEEARAGKLSTELAEAKSHIISLDIELMRLQKKHKAYHATAETTAARLEQKAEHAKEVSQRLYAQHTRLSRLLERLGLAVSYQDDVMVIERASKVGASTVIDPQASQMTQGVTLSSPPPTRNPSTVGEPPDLSFLHWPEAQTVEEEVAQFQAYNTQLSRFNIETFSDAVVKRVRDFEYTARKYNKEARESSRRADAYKEKSVKLKSEGHAKIAVKDFKEGDLALFLPTRGQPKGAWAAFNVGCPHFFLAEKDGMALGNRDFIVARITNIEERTVDLSRSAASHQAADGQSIGEASSITPSADDENPFELSDGLRWWLVHANEERGTGGAPTTPGLGKSTVAAANVDARGSIRIKRNSKGEDATKHLNKSLDSRRSSSASKKGIIPTIANASGSPTVGTFAEGSRQRSESQASQRPPPAQAGGSGTSGLGIVTSASDAQSAGDQARKPPEARAASRSISPGSKARARSKSPSKSIRSLQKHLEPHGSPAKASPAKSPAKKQAWESLWQAEFSLESPSKGGK